MTPIKASRFPRTSRLLRHADFERVYKQGRRHFSATMTVFYLARPKAEDRTRTVARLDSGASKLAPSGLRVGFTVGRVLGGAVQRNRMKRRLREAVRMALPRTNVAADVVINPKKSLLSVDFSAVLTEVSRAFEVIEQKLSGKSVEKLASGSAANRAVGNREPEAGNGS
jgi:ribonuclease P protein component